MTQRGNNTASGLVPQIAQTVGIVVGVLLLLPLVHEPSGVHPSGSGSTSVFHGHEAVANVRDYGATGDPNQDARPAIQQALAAAPHTVLFPAGTYFVKDHVTFEKGLGGNVKVPVQVIFLEGAQLKPAKNKTMRFLGPIEAPPSHIFDETDGGIISFEDNKKIGKVYAEWWGATGNEDSNDDAPAINRALKAVGGNREGQGVLVGLSTRYDIKDTLVVYDNTRWEGQSSIATLEGDGQPYQKQRVTVYKMKKGVEKPIVKNFDAGNAGKKDVDVHLRHLLFNGNYLDDGPGSGNAHGIHLENVLWGSIENVSVQNCKGHGVFVKGSPHLKLTNVRAKLNGRDGIRIVDSVNVHLDHVNCEDNHFGNGVSLGSSDPKRKFTGGAVLIESIWLEDNGITKKKLQGGGVQIDKHGGSGLVVDVPSVTVIAGRASNSDIAHIHIKNNARCVQIIGFDPRPHRVGGEPVKEAIRIDSKAKGVVVIGVPEDVFKRVNGSFFPSIPDGMFLLHGAFPDPGSNDPDPVPDPLLLKVTGAALIDG